ncbi:MAG: CHAT domain-containing protein [Cyanobacteria bacterium P01_D01_bin.116]
MKKILILGANPKNTSNLRLDEEVREIKNALQLSPNRDEFLIITESAVRVDDLIGFLSNHQPAIVHFCGHGSGTDGLVLEDNSGLLQLVSAEALARLFRPFQQQIECVLLNACYSEVQATEIHQHIDCVIGMNKAIGDKAAIKFSVGFYTTLWSGMSYEDCFDMGCTSIGLQGIPEYLTPVIKIRRRYQGEPTLPSQVTPEVEPKQSSRSFIVGDIAGDFKPIGSPIMSDNVEISGTVAESINQLPVFTDSIKPNIKEVLSQLNQVISSSSDLNDDDKTEALEQLIILSEAGNNPSDEATKKKVRTAVKILKGTVHSLSDATNLAKVCSKLLPLITKFFEL